MEDQTNNRRPEHEELVVEFAARQLQLFQESDSRCRGLELPEGIMLRYTLSQDPLYFYLRTGIKDGKIQTRIFASDSPYDRLKTGIGECNTPMFEAGADFNHFKKIEKLLHSWVDFIHLEQEGASTFRSFEVHEKPED